MKNITNGGFLGMSNIVFINSNFESCLKKLENSKDKIVIVLVKVENF